MSSHDPFGGDGDRTILKPTPGGRAPGGNQPPPQQAPPQRAAAPMEPMSITASGSNPLVSSAAPLFALVAQLRTSVSHPDPTSLQAHVAQEITAFEAKARQLGEPPENVLAARYATCTLIDETALSTPWGVESNWSGQTLLVRFHNEARGGEKFFQILDRLLQDPARNLHLLEYLYICLALGFEGKYKLQSRGHVELDQIQHNVYEAIRRFKGDPERDLSLRWRGVEDKRPRLAQYLPLWVLGAIGASIAIAAFVAFWFTLSANTDPISARLTLLGRDTVPLETRASLPVIQTVTLEDVLRDDPQVTSAIGQGKVQVQETNNQATVRMWELFPSGQGNVANDSNNLVKRIAAGLSTFTGRVQVVGHTDNQPLSRSLRFPSNWALSETRAQSVSSLLSEVLPAGRVTSEGRADTDPLVANDNAVNMALNRRVEITLFYEAAEL